MLPAQVPEAQPEPEAGDLSLCLIKQYHPRILQSWVLSKASV